MSAPESPQAGGRVSTPVLIGIVVITCVAVSWAGALSLAGKGLGDMMSVLALLAVPALGVLGVALYGKQEALAQKTEAIHQQSNGNTQKVVDALIARLERTEALLSPLAAVHGGVVTPPVLVVSPSDSSAPTVTAVPAGVSAEG